MAKTFWPNEDPLGKRVDTFSLKKRASWTMVIGIVADARTESLENARIPQIFASCIRRERNTWRILYARKFRTLLVRDKVRTQG